MYRLLVGACLLVVGVSGQRFRQPAQSVAAGSSFGLSPLDNTTPVPILVDSRRIDLHTGAFVYEYAGGDGSSKFEFRYPNGTVVGNYSFVNELGEQETRQYAAGVLPTDVDETTDPNYVDLGNYEHYRHLERPYVHSGASPTGQFFQAPVAQAPRAIPQARPQPRLPAQTPRAPVQTFAPVQSFAPVQTFAPVPVQPVAPVRQSVPQLPIQSLARPVAQHAPRPPVQVPQVSVPINSAAQSHFAQTPIVAPTFDLGAFHTAAAPAPAPAPVHRPAPVLHRPVASLGQLGGVAAQPQPVAQSRHRLDLSQPQGQSTSDFLDSIISQFQ